MKVRDLITLLADYPPNAEIHLIGLEEPWLADRSEYTLDEAQALCEDCSGNMLLIDGRKTDDNAYRRGALEQLFDEVSTGIKDRPDGRRLDAAESGVRHDDIRAAGGDPTGSALEEHFDLFIAEVASFISTERLGDWPTEDGIREKVDELFEVRFWDELENTGADIDDDVREDPGAWERLVQLAIGRAGRMVGAAHGR